MAAVLAGLANLATVVFAVSSMLSVGFSFSLREILSPLRNVGGVIRALIANFVLVPLLAYFVVKLLALEAPLAIGLILIASGAGAPFLIRLTTAAGGNVALSATLLVLLLPATIIYLPLVVPLFVPNASVNALAIGMPLVITMLVPLALGLWINAKAPRRALRWQPVLAKTSSYSLVALVALTLLSNLSAALDVTMRAILAALLVLCGAFAIGYVLGGRKLDSRAVMGLGTGQRNVAAAMVVATQTIGHPDTIIMVITVAMLGLAVLFPIATKLRELEAAMREPRPPSQAPRIRFTPDEMKTSN